MFKKKSILILFIFLSINLCIVPLFADSEKKSNVEIPKIKFQYGPTTAKLSNIAEIQIPKNFVFADGDETRKIMALYGNQPTNIEVGYIEPKSGKWFIVFDYKNIGYIKDDDKDELDQEAILESLKEGNKHGNEWRKQNGMAPLNLIGWHTKPHYDSKSHNLEWATLSESEGKKIINYNIRFLGRKGVMEAVLVASPKELTNAIKDSKKLLKKYQFSSGNKYSEFMEGDKVAKYGLAALVTGGAVAVAAKSGLLSRFWKLIVAILIGIVAIIKRFFKSLFNREDKTIIGSNQNNDVAKQDK